MTLLSSLLISATAATAPRPHLIAVIGDDIGYNSVGYHGNNPEAKTPTMDALAANGTVLDRMYAFCWCSPSRAAVTTGRFPHHVYQNNMPVTAPDAGPPLQMTTLAEKLSDAGYMTVQAGKWHLGNKSQRTDRSIPSPLTAPHPRAGFGRKEYLPVYRGFGSSFGYLTGAENHYNQLMCSDGLCLNATGELGGNSSTIVTDLWRDESAGFGLNNTGSWGDDRWTKFVTDSFAARGDRPVFAYLALGAAHTPLQAPDWALAMFEDVAFSDRRYYNAMMSWVDASIANLTSALKAEGMWEDTLLWFWSDNGGPVYYDFPGQPIKSGGGSNNFPLRGGKLSMFEGGVRVVSFLSGGLLPAAARGTQLSAITSVVDVYATFVDLAGGNLTDEPAAAAGLPPIDGHSLMPVLEQKVRSTRTSLVLALGFNLTFTYGAAMIDGDLKLIYGQSAMNFEQAPVWPDAPYEWVWEPRYMLNCSIGCLFNLTADPSERRDLAAEQPLDLQRMAVQLKDELSRRYETDPGEPESLRFKMQIQKTGFLGPFVS